jgi:gliding motility-associated-like protein
MKTPIIFLLLILNTFCVAAQSTFQKVIKNQKNSFISNIKASPDGQSAYAVSSDGTISANMFKIDTVGNIVWAKKISENYSFYLDAFTPVTNGVIFSVNIFDNSNLQVAHLIRIDAQGKLLWRKKINYDSLYINRLVEDDDGNFWTTINKIQSANLYSEYTFLTKFDPNGNVLECKQIKFNGTKVGGWHIAFDKKSQSIVVNLNGDFTSDKSYIFSFDKQSNLKWAKAMPSYLRVFDWKTMSSSIIFSGGFTLANQGYIALMIGKINMANGNIETIKIIPQNDFPFVSTNDRSIALGFFENKKLLQLDENLTPIWTKTYDKCSEKINFYPGLAPNGDCYFTKYNPDAGSFIYGKTNAKGEIAGCNLKDASTVILRDTAWTQPQEFKNFTISNPGISLLNSSIKIENTSFKVEDYCPRPDASFSIPKVVCENSDFKPFNIKFPMDAHQWTFGADKSNDTTPVINFNIFGKKRIFHEVTVENCTDTLSKEIDVLRAPTLPRDTQICNSKTFVLDFKNSFADTFYQNNKLFTPPLNISQSGIYSFLLKNKICETKGDINITLKDVPPISFLIDSTYCKDEPYIAQLSNFKKVTWDKLIVSDTFWIRDAAAHTYEAEYDGCRVAGTLKIPRKTCPLPEIIYIPNAFSPNDDGINDLFQVFGRDFKILRMAIFDRWGNQVFDATLPDSAWNGSFRNQLSPQGVYTYFIDYQDLKRDIKRIKMGDVMLWR